MGNSVIFPPIIAWSCCDVRKSKKPFIGGCFKLSSMRWTGQELAALELEEAPSHHAMRNASAILLNLKAMKSSCLSSLLPSFQPTTREKGPNPTPDNQVSAFLLANLVIFRPPFGRFGGFQTAHDSKWISKSRFKDTRSTLGCKSAVPSAIRNHW